MKLNHCQSGTVLEFGNLISIKEKQARRIYWTYGPNRAEITILGIEPHPEDKKRDGYSKIKLSNLP